jgi:hypothetical protein
MADPFSIELERAKDALGILFADARAEVATLREQILSLQQQISHRTQKLGQGPRPQAGQATKEGLSQWLENDSRN